MMNSTGLGVIVAVAAGISAGLVIALLPLLRRHALAHPNARSSHIVPTPQGGGIAVIAATLLVAASAVLLVPRDVALSPASLWLVGAATLFIALVGAADDLKPIEVAPRLLLQALAVLVMVASLPAELR